MDTWVNQSTQFNNQIAYDNDMLDAVALSRKHLLEALLRIDQLEVMLKNTTVELLAYKEALLQIQTSVSHSQHAARPEVSNGSNGQVYPSTKTITIEDEVVSE